jgi:dephospho-CoA kinase
VVLGLTGKYCSGKNMVAGYFVNRGWLDLDIDRFGHDALQIKSDEVIKEFGPGIRSEDGNIDRKRLGVLVFSSSKKLSDLESIIHPEMIIRCKKEIQNNNNRHIIINAAILHKMGLNTLCNSILWVESPLFIRVNRGRSRDNLNLLSIIRRIYGQRKLDAKYWQEDVDIYNIMNSGSGNSLEAEVNFLIDIFEERV